MKTQKCVKGAKQWYAVYTKPQKECYAEFNIQKRGVETFFPKLALPKAPKRKPQNVSLFPNYIFVRLDILSELYSSVKWCPGVKRIVSFNGTPAAVDDLAIAFLMRQAQPDGTICARLNIEIGQEVSISGGPFDGLVGIIQNPPNARGRVGVLLNLLNRLTKVEVPVHFVNAGWVLSEARVDA